MYFRLVTLFYKTHSIFFNKVVGKMNIKFEYQ